MPRAHFSQEAKENFENYFDSAKTSVSGTYYINSTYDHSPLSGKIAELEERIKELLIDLSIQKGLRAILNV